MSLVIPFYNEAENIYPLFNEIREVFAGKKFLFEVIGIDDGSDDDTISNLNSFRREHPDFPLIILELKCNSGQTAAFSAGITQAKGEVIVTLDGDRQNDPTNIFDLLDFYPEFDVVVGIRKKRRDHWVRRISSITANGIRNFLTGDQIVDTGCSLKLFKASLLKEIPLFSGLHRFFPTLCKYHGGRVKQIPVNHRERTAGLSKYNVWNRILVSFLDCLAVCWMKRRIFKIEFKPHHPEIITKK